LPDLEDRATVGIQPERLSGFYKKHEEGGYMAAFFHAFGESRRKIPGYGAASHEDIRLRIIGIL